MPDDQPEPQAPKPPPLDPFSPMHVGHVAMLEMYRGLRRAGAGMVEAAIMMGGILVAQGEAGNNKGQP